MKDWRFLLFAVALSVAACGSLASRPPLHAQEPAGHWYVVKEGDTPAGIAKQAGIPVEDFLEINGLRRSERLTPGQWVFLLDPAGLQASPGMRSTGGAPVPMADGSARLRWPLHRPLLTSPFGTRWGRPHEGIDMAAPIGTPVIAAAAGTVLYAGDRVRGYGNMIVLQHSDGLVTVYAHNSALRVRTGDRVTLGQEIALVGDSGRSTAPHLHFEVRSGNVPQDPIPFLPPLK